MRTTTTAAAALVVWTVGCGAGTKSTWQPSLGPTVALVEVDEDGDTHVIAPGATVEVDVNSRIELHVDRTEIAKVMGSRVALTAQIDASAKRLEALAKLTEEQTAIIAQHNSLVTRQASLAATELDVQQKSLGTREKALTNAVEAYGRSQNYDNERLDTFFSGNGMEGTFAALDAERRDAILQADALIERVAHLRWRMQATLATGDKSTAIHLEGYDEYEAGAYRRIDKLVPVTDKLPAQLAEANRIAAATGNLSRARDLLVENLRKQVKENVEAVKKALLDDVRTLETFPDRVVAAVKAVDGVKDLLAAAKELVAQARAVETGCRPVFTVIADARLGDLTLGDAMACADAIQKAAPLIVDAATKAKASVAKIRAATPGLAAALRAEVEKLKDDLTLMDTVTERVESAKNRWLTIHKLLNDNYASATAPVWRSDKQTDRAVTDLADTAIDLTRTDRKEGDRVEFRPSIVDNNVAVVVGGSTVMNVVRTGLYIDVSAAVLFLEPVDDNADELEAAPAIVAAAHYRFRERGSFVSLRRFVNFLQPGIGLHFGSPDLGSSDPAMMTEDPALEMGVGGNVLLFGDLLQAGVGYDLQVGSTYAFVGFGLNTLGKLGVRVPL